MELYEEIILDIIKKDNTFSERKIFKILESKIYAALTQIHAILKNEDFEDFMCVEEIIIILENLGLDCGSRHDF